jgi:hypothetical protein
MGSIQRKSSKNNRQLYQNKKESNVNPNPFPDNLRPTYHRPSVRQLQTSKILPLRLDDETNGVHQTVYQVAHETSKI